MKSFFVAFLSIVAHGIMATPADRFVAALRTANDNPSMFFEKLAELPRRRITVQQDMEIFLTFWRSIVEPGMKTSEIKIPGKSQHFVKDRLKAFRKDPFFVDFLPPQRETNAECIIQVADIVRFTTGDSRQRQAFFKYREGRRIPSEKSPAPVSGNQKRNFELPPPVPRSPPTMATPSPPTTTVSPTRAQNDVSAPNAPLYQVPRIESTRLAPRPAIVCDYSMPPPHLEYDTWTELRPRQHGPLPTGVLIHNSGCHARIAPTSDFFINGAMVCLFYDSNPNAPVNVAFAFDHTIEDIKRTTTLDEISNAVHLNLQYKARNACNAAAIDDGAFMRLLRSTETTLVLARRLANNEIVPISDDPRSTVEEVGFFNFRSDVIITNVATGTLQQQLYFASHGLGSSRPNAQEHGSLLNNLLAADHSNHDEKTHLDQISHRQWKQISTFGNKITKKPSCVCFNCGSLEYPSRKSIFHFRRGVPPGAVFASSDHYELTTFTT